MTVKRQLSLVLAGYVAIAGTEILVHWGLAQQCCRLLLNIYLMSNLVGNSGMSIIPDLIIPAGLLGYWNGRLARRASSRHGKWFVIPLAAGIVALYPVYDALIRTVSFVWWWPKSVSAALYLFTLHLLFGAGIIFKITAGMSAEDGPGLARSAQ